mgnify:CR=1 FL=1
MQAMALDTRYSHADGILKQDVSGSVVLFNMDDGRYYALNELGARVWDLCDGALRLSGVVDAICDEYDAPRATITQDVVDLIRELVDEGLVVEADQTA